MLTLGSFSNDDGDGKKNGQKVILLLRKKKKNKKNNNFSRASHFFVHSLQSLHDYHVKMPNITLVSDDDFSLSF